MKGVLHTSQLFTTEGNYPICACCRVFAYMDLIIEMQR